MNPSVFKAYDIRGLVDGELDEPFARRLGKALVHIHKPRKVAVARDMRPSSEKLEETLVEALVAGGADVTRLGLCSTPMFYFALGEGSAVYDLGVMVTASHNPSQYNGFKLCSAAGVPMGLGSGLEKIRDLMLSDEVMFEAVGHGAMSADENLLDRYLDRVSQLAALPAELPAWRVAVDTGNGMAGLVMPKINTRFAAIDFIRLYWDLDGNFPNHEANPLKTETLAELRETVTRDQCVMGAAFDGDADRVGFVDETGAPIPGDIMTALLARELLLARGPAKIVYDVRSSWSVPEIVREAGGVPVMSPVGHAKIKRLMAQESALFAGELSMHFYFADMWNHESGDLAMLLVLKMLLREQKPLSQLWKPLQRYASSGEINFTVSDPAAVIQTLEKQYASEAAEASRLDGLRLDFKDWWFSVRPSNTEPLLRLNLEARTPEEMEQHKSELQSIISGR